MGRGPKAIYIFPSEAFDCRIRDLSSNRVEDLETFQGLDRGFLKRIPPDAQTSDEEVGNSLIMSCRRLRVGIKESQCIVLCETRCETEWAIKRRTSQARLLSNVNKPASKNQNRLGGDNTHNQSFLFRLMLWDDKRENQNCSEWPFPSHFPSLRAGKGVFEGAERCKITVSHCIASLKCFRELLPRPFLTTIVESMLNGKN